MVTRQTVCLKRIQQPSCVCVSAPCLLNSSECDIFSSAVDAVYNTTEGHEKNPFAEQKTAMGFKNSFYILFRLTAAAAERVLGHSHGKPYIPKTISSSLPRACNAKGLC